MNRHMYDYPDALAMTDLKVQESKSHTVKEAAALLPNSRGGTGVAPALVYRLVSDGRIKKVPGVRPIQISQTALDDYVAKYKPHRHHYKLSDRDAMARIYAVLTNETTAANAARQSPPISISGMTRLIKAQRRPYLARQVLEIIERSKEMSETVTLRQAFDALGDAEPTVAAALEAQPNFDPDAESTLRASRRPDGKLVIFDLAFDATFFGLIVVDDEYIPF